MRVRRSKNLPSIIIIEIFLDRALVGVGEPRHTQQQMVLIVMLSLLALALVIAVIGTFFYFLLFVLGRIR